MSIIASENTLCNTLFFSDVLQSSCAPGWKLIDGMCYMVTETPSTYFNAYLACSLNGADLVSITNEDLNSQLQAM